MQLKYFFPSPLTGYQPIHQISFLSQYLILEFCTSPFLEICFFISLLVCSLKLCKYALLMNPLARSIEELLPVRISSSLWFHILLRTALVVSTVCVAFILPFFGIPRKSLPTLNNTNSNQPSFSSVVDLVPVPFCRSCDGSHWFSS